jgi:hypothetical protein
MECKRINITKVIMKMEADTLTSFRVKLSLNFGFDTSCDEAAMISDIIVEI